MYVYNAFTVIHSDRVALRNVTLYAAGGMGLYASNTSNIELDGFRVVKAPGRVMSITADGFHSSNTRGGGVVVRNCVFEGQGDDGINVPTVWTDIESISPDRRTLTVGKDGALGANWDTLAVGAPLDYFNRSSLLPLGTGVVSALTPPATVVLSAPLPLAVGLFDLINSAAGYADYVEVRGRRRALRTRPLWQRPHSHPRAASWVRGCTPDHALTSLRSLTRSSRIIERVVPC